MFIKKEKIIILITILLLIPFSSAACEQNNIFVENNSMDICGLCRVDYFDNPCPDNVNCTLSIYTENRTMILNNSMMSNQSNGKYIYNHNLSSGDYIGEMACEGKLVSFKIVVNSKSSNTGAIGPGFPEGYFNKNESIINITNDRLVKDINSFFDNTEEYFFPQNKTLSFYIIIFILILVMFYKEIYLLIKKLEFQK